MEQKASTVYFDNLLSKYKIAITELSDKTQNRINKFNSEKDQERKDELNELISIEIADYIEMKNKKETNRKNEEDKKRAEEAARIEEAKREAINVSEAETAKVKKEDGRSRLFKRIFPRSK